MARIESRNISSRVFPCSPRLNWTPFATKGLIEFSELFSRELLVLISASRLPLDPITMRHVHSCASRERSRFVQLLGWRVTVRQLWIKARVHATSARLKKQRTTPESSRLFIRVFGNFSSTFVETFQRIVTNDVRSKLGLSIFNRRFDQRYRFEFVYRVPSGVPIR